MSAPALGHQPDPPLYATRQAVRRAMVRLDEALAEIEDARRSPGAAEADPIVRECMDEAFRRATEALAWAERARDRIPFRTAMGML